MEATSTEYGELKSAEQSGRYAEVIAGVRSAIDVDRRKALSDRWTQGWIGRRWRNLFIANAETDPAAIDAVRRFAGLPVKFTTGPMRERLTRRFLGDDRLDEVHFDMPPTEIERLDDTTILFAPGLLTGLLPALAFESVWPGIEERLGVRVIAADSHPGRGCDSNTADIMRALRAGEGYDAHSQLRQGVDAIPRSGTVLAMGYSKGAPDLLHAMRMFPEEMSQLTAVITWAGAVGGSYLADGIYDKVRHLPLERLVPDSNLARSLQRLVPVADLRGMSRRLDEYDWKAAIHDLTTTASTRWLADNAAAIDELDVPFFGVAGRTTLHEVPSFEIESMIELNRHDVVNDMQLVHAQAQVPAPMVTELGVVHAHHWDMSYDTFPRALRMTSFNLDHRFARAAALTALFQLMGELGLAH